MSEETLSVITCTYQRPQAMALCEKYMARQTKQPDQWLILDGPKPMREKVLAAIERGSIAGNNVAFCEDDDAYSAVWLEWCHDKLARYDIVGEGNAIYYNVAARWWSHCRNVRHASLCNTAIKSSLLAPLANVIRGFDNNFFDTRLWRLEARRFLQLDQSDKRMVYGIKGMPGTRGYSPEHKPETPPGVNADPSALKMWKLLGADAKNYLPFYQR